MQIDRHMAVWSYIGAAALGASLMAAPEYFHFGPRVAGIVFWGGLGIFAVSTILMLVLFAIGRDRKHSVSGPLLLIGVGAICLTAGLFWLYGSRDEKNASFIEGSLFVSCELTTLPSALPANGYIEVIRLPHQNMQTKGGQLVAESRLGSPGSKIEWPESFLGGPPSGWRCEITNDSPEALLEVSVPFEIGLGQNQSIAVGSPQPDRVHAFTITRLDVGPANRRTVYLFNESAEGGVGTVLSVGSAYKLGQTARQSIRIERPVTDLKKFLLLMPHLKIPDAEKTTDKPRGGSGGKAGSDDGGIAVGGKGGAAGDLGDGGHGGDANARGSGSFALGGEGGEGARSDRAAKGGRGPFDVLNHPLKDMIVPGTNMRLGDFGRGGDSAPPERKKD